MKPRTRLGKLVISASRSHAKSGNGKRPELTARQKSVAGKFIAEELATHKYPPRQAVAIGLARARRGR